MFVRDIGMIASGSELGSASSETVKVVFADVNGVEFDVVFDVCANGLQKESVPSSRYSGGRDNTYVHVEPAEVRPEFFLFFGTNVFKVLITEDNDASFSDEQG